MISTKHAKGLLSNYKYKPITAPECCHVLNICVPNRLSCPINSQSEVGGSDPMIIPYYKVVTSQSTMSHITGSRPREPRPTDFSCSRYYILASFLPTSSPLCKLPATLFVTRLFLSGGPCGTGSSAMVSILLTIYHFYYTIITQLLPIVESLL